MTYAKKLQHNLGVTTDGDIGRGTLTALFRVMGAGPQRAIDLALGANVHLRTYGILDTGLRLAHFMGQTAHESGGYQYMEEIGSAVYFARYNNRADLGNVVPGDGPLFHGRGPIQLTGRANYRKYGQDLGLDFENNPAMVALPAVGMLVACKYWSDHGLNELADADNLERITRKINGGVNGLDDRKARIAKAKGLIL
ncbi:MAG TPA: glycoside hydrolase family 19 protein [Sphingomonas sp.]|jgi:putative chitinase